MGAGVQAPSSHALGDFLTALRPEDGVVHLPAVEAAGNLKKKFANLHSLYFHLIDGIFCSRFHRWINVSIVSNAPACRSVVDEKENVNMKTHEYCHRLLDEQSPYSDASSANIGLYGATKVECKNTSTVAANPDDTCRR